MMFSLGNVARYVLGFGQQRGGFKTPPCLVETQALTQGSRPLIPYMSRGTTAQVVAYP